MEWGDHRELHEIVAAEREQIHILRRIERHVARIDRTLHPDHSHPAAIHIVFEGDHMGQISVPDSDLTSKTATANVTDERGNPTVPEGVVEWVSDNEAVATVDASADPSGLTAQVTPTGTIGTANITATDPVSGATGSGQFNVTAGAPAAIDVEFS